MYLNEFADGLEPRDMSRSQELASLLASSLPDGRLITVPDCGHNVHSQNTPGFLAGIAPFLASLG